MGGKSAFVLLLAVSCILTSVVVAVDEPFCTSKFDFEEKILYKVIRLEHAMELLQREVRENLNKIDKRQALDAADKALARDLYITFFCRCPDTWINFNGSCYLFSQEVKTFSDAEQFCQHHQSDLVKIDNCKENNFIKSHSSNLKGGSRWIGLSDVAIEGEWVWTDGTKAFCLDWNQGEPNGDKTESCAVLSDAVQYKWNDARCGKTYMPICETLLSACQSGEGSIDG